MKDARHDDTQDGRGEVNRNRIKAFDLTQQLETKSATTARERRGRSSVNM